MRGVAGDRMMPDNQAVIGEGTITVSGLTEVLRERARSHPDRVAYIAGESEITFLEQLAQQFRAIDPSLLRQPPATTTPSPPASKARKTSRR